MRIAIVNDNKGHLLMLSRIVEKCLTHEIIWIAYDGREAVEKCRLDRPDIILMDLVMPKVNGVMATREIMAQSPCAILLVTASVAGNASLIFEAMGAGALDVVKTPIFGDRDEKRDTDAILSKIRIVQNLIAPGKLVRNEYPLAENNSVHVEAHKPILCFGASTGGPAALATILSQLPVDFPVPVVIIQHVDEYFSASFADWLNKQCQLTVQIARNGDRPEVGKVLIAGTSNHMLMDSHHRLVYADSNEESNYKPSVNVFFNSLVKHWDDCIIACLLTGMGRDGATGLLNIRNKGGYTITQSKDSCAVYGMPKAADDIDASMHSITPEEIPSFIMEFLSHNKLMAERL